MKIAFVTHTAYPEFIGGREQHVHFFAKACSELKKDDIVVFTSGNARKVTRQRIDDTYWLVEIPNIPITVSKNPLQIYRIVPQLYNLFKKEKPDILHLFEYGSYTTTVAAFYAIRRNLPFILTVYGYQLTNPILRLCKKIYDFVIGKYLLRKSRAIICVSKQQYHEMLFIGGKNIKEKIFIKANNIPLGYYKDSKLQKLDDDFYQDFPFLKEKGIKLLTVARMLPRKGIDILIKALYIIVHKHKMRDVKLILAGPDCGEYRNIETMVHNLGLAYNVHLLGVISHTNIMKLFRAVDIIVSPSLYEGVPLVLLEAMFFGKLIIASALPGVKDVIKDGETGVLVEPGDIHSLAQAIITFSLDSIARNRIGKQAREATHSYDSSREVEFLYDTIYAGTISRQNQKMRNNL